VEIYKHNLHRKKGKILPKNKEISSILYLLQIHLSPTTL